MEVWTKQHVKVLELLKRNGSFFARRKFVQNDLGSDAEIMALVYDELVKNHPQLNKKPFKAEVPVWVSFSYEATMKPSQDFVILNLEIPDSEITRVNIAKWGMMLNYSYIPLNKADEARHRELVKKCGVDDTRAVMTQFYPELKSEIVESWSRLFDDSIKIGGDASYGLVWQLKKEWLKGIID
jgi:hypothetical protein